MRTLGLLSTTLLLSSILSAQYIQSGPMLGYLRPDEALIWLQLENEGAAQVLFWPRETPAQKDSSGLRYTSASVAHTLKWPLSPLKPGTHYAYQVMGKAQWQSDTFYFQTPLAQAEELPEIKLAMGSCAYIPKEAQQRAVWRQEGRFEIFSQIAAQNPDVMLWLGDNTYLSQGDWWTRTGYQQRYTDIRRLPELQPLLSGCQHFATWDDHEFGPNNATGAWIHKDLALETFRLFWANHSYGYRDLPGVMSAFQYYDLEVILLDNRFYRSLPQKDGGGQVFGREQIDRCIDLLRASRAKYKFVAMGGQFLNSAARFENYAQYPQERAYFYQRLRDANLQGVILLSGDRHASEVLVDSSSFPHAVVEITSSPLTARTYNSADEANHFRLAGSYFAQHSFALLHLSGSRNDRKLHLRFYNSQGEAIFQYNISDLQN